MSKKQIERAFSGPPGQVVVIVKEGAATPLRRSASGKAGAPAELQNTLSKLGVKLVPLFGETESHVAKLVARAIEAAPPAAQENIRRMSTFYTLESIPKAGMKKVVEDLKKLEMVEGAYVKPLGEPPVYYEMKNRPGAAADSGSSVPITQDLSPNQAYLNAAPGGIDARYAWTLPGGRGNDVTIIDIEGG